MQQRKRRRRNFHRSSWPSACSPGQALTASPAQAVSGPGPYYAEPAWDQKIGAATRFLVLTNWASQAVLDKETGLVWERSPATTTHTWSLARFECAEPHDRQPQRLAAALGARAGEPGAPLRASPRPDPPAGPPVSDCPVGHLLVGDVDRAQSGQRVGRAVQRWRSEQRR